MQNECNKGNDNYYFLCRKKASEHNDALSSRLGAASRLNISESALRNYEVDTANVPQDIVCAMADLYGMPEMETHYCKNDCLYCGIRHSNTHADRYRLSTEQIMACCKSGYELGFRTFVLQGGEDPYYTDERICEIVSGKVSGLRSYALYRRKVKGELSELF